LLSNLGLKVTIGKFIAGKLGVMTRFDWCNRDAIFYFPPDFAVFCYFHSELFRCNPPVFRCFLLFQNGYKSRRFASRQAAFMMAKASSPIG
jgi:hypothetical protein